MTVAQATAAASYKKVILKNWAPFTKCIRRIKNKQVDTPHDIEVVMPMHNLIEHSDNYWKTSGILWQYCRGQWGQWNKKKLMVPFKYLSNFWRTLEMPLINCETNLDLNWFKNCIIVANNADKTTRFSITDTILYVPVVTLST